jgi:hypothetical protein
MVDTTTTPSAPRDPIDLQSILARIDRDLSESRRAREESEKLVAETRKLRQERKALKAGKHKLRRDVVYAAWIPVAGMIGGTIAVVQLVLHAFKLI